MTATATDDTWRSAWPDLVAFLSVLGLAWWTQARATDLVWSLWLSSLVVGYVIIVWAIMRLPIRFLAGAAAEPRLFLDGLAHNGVAGNALLVVIALVGMGFALAFFTVHFGGFHYVHAGFLQYFFPIGGKWDGSTTLWTHDLTLYREVARRYWIYLPAAFLAERAVFLQPPAGGLSALPYRKVMRMHGLIFFFGIAHFAGADNFAVYAVVYAVYFFPWRLVKRPPAPATLPAAAERA
jgi:hypothetical protein